MTFTYRYPPGKKPGNLWFELEKPYTLPMNDFMPHDHDYMELTLITQGTGWHRVGGIDHPTAPGEVIIIPPRTVHAYFRSKKQTHRNFHFDPALLSEIRKDAEDRKVLNNLFPAPETNPKKYSMARFRLTPKELAIAEKMADEIEAEQGGYQTGRALSMRLAFQKLVLYLTRLYAQRTTKTLPENSGLAKSLEYLNRQLLKPLNLSQLAQVSGMSTSHFRRQFRKAFGDSPINYLIRLRIRRACSLLEKGDLSITEIAFRCGFTDSNYFTRQFTKVMGSNPRQYRELFPR